MMGAVRKASYVKEMCLELIREEMETDEVDKARNYIALLYI